MKWLGKNECDICRERGVNDPTIKGKKAYDAPTVFGGWAFMCRNCYNTYSTKRMGQEYTKDENGDFIKTKDIGQSKGLFDMEEYAAELLGF